MSKGFLISFDGVDSSGKATQTKQLIVRLKNMGVEVSTFQTPDYTLKSGQKLKQLLQNTTLWQKKSWQEKLRYFADNRAEHREEVVTALSAGHVVVYDRYVPSSLAFIMVEAMAQGEVPKRRTYIQNQIAHYEYVAQHMPRENLSIFLDVPPGTAEQLLYQRQKERQDKSEYTDHIAVQKKLYHEYKLLIKQNPENYLKVQCVTDNHLRSIEVIAADIWQGIQLKFPEAKKWDS